MPLIGPKPDPGDLIEFLGTGYDHWGVYVGDGYIVHLTAGDGESSVSWGSGSSGYSSGSSKRAVVKKQTLEQAAKGRKYKVNNKYDGKKAPRSPEEIVARAEEEVGKKKYYHLTKDNCEHFATDLRYGQSFCEQATNAGMCLGGGVVSGTITGFICVIGGAPIIPAVSVGAVAGTCIFGITYVIVRKFKMIL